MHADAAAAVIGSKVIQFLSEEVADTPLAKRNGSAVFSGGSEATNRRRTLLSSLQARGSPLLSLLIAAASAYMQSSIANTSNGETAEAEKNQGAVRASLEALAALASWLPLKVLKDSQLLDVCSSLLQSPPLQGHAVEVLLQVLQLHCSGNLVSPVGKVGICLQASSSGLRDFCFPPLIQSFLAEGGCASADLQQE